MGQGTSSGKSGRGMGAAPVAAGTVAVNCNIRATVRALPGAERGAGRLRRSADQVVAVADGKQLAVCDPGDPLTARLYACLRQEFEYEATVDGDPGAAFIDVGPVP